MMKPTAAVVTIWARILGKYDRQHEQPFLLKKKFICMIIEKYTKYF
jgi:hypothetical protein